MLPCSNLTSGIAKFSLGLLIMKGRGKLLPGTPLRFTLRKECSHRGMNSSIDFSPHSQGSVLISASLKDLILSHAFATNLLMKFREFSFVIACSLFNFVRESLNRKRNCSEKLSVELLCQHYIPLYRSLIKLS